MNTPEEILKDLGYPLEKTTPEGKLVDSLVVEGQTLYASGQVAFDGDQLVSKGKVPSQVSLEAATQAAALCAANVLRAVRKRLDSFARVERVLRITGYGMPIRTSPTAPVINGASIVRRLWRRQPSCPNGARTGPIAPGLLVE
jgi:enamine deaminase RidA (YjgF/YER057c/UK114 family)